MAFLLYLQVFTTKLMKTILFILLSFPIVFVAQKSIIQEQSDHYQNFNFLNDTQWDSLNLIEQGRAIYANSSALKSVTTASCILTKKVYGWHPYWVGSVYANYDWSMLSDFCYFDYSVSPATGNNTNGSFAWSTSAAVTAAKTNSVNIHFCATMFSSHATFWGSATAQQTFITNAINLLNSRGGQGINVDFEGMGSSDKVPFKTFMTNLCNQVHAANTNYKVSMALYAVDWSTSFDMPALNLIVDNFIIMGYDYYYSGSTTAGPEAPLYNFQTGYNYTLSKSITYYLKQGATNNKLLVGLPWYGREWETSGTIPPSSTTGNFTSSRTYSYVRNNAATYSAANKRWDTNSFNPYYNYTSGGNNRQCWIDDAYSLSRKFDMVNQRGLGGIGIWALGYDDGYQDYWQAIKNKFSTCAVVACTDSIYDMGGPGRNYYDSETYMYTIAPTGTNKVRLTFTQMDLEQGFDSLYIFDGPTNASIILGAFTGSVVPGIINSSGSNLTLKFKSDGSTNKGGFKAKWNCIQDNTSPTSQINAPVGWITQDFVTTFTDNDNTGGTGIEKSFYQPSYFNGTEWRANGNRGFFNDDFNGATIHNDWFSPAASGTWSINTNALVQSDETNANTNLYAAVTQSLSNRYLYNFKATLSGTGSNRRAGIHIFCDAPTQSNRGNNYLLMVRPDQGTIELYKNTANVLSVVKTVTFTINVNVVYDYKITYDRISGELKLWVNNAFVTSWIDTSPFATGNSISFRSGNCNFKIDDLKIFRSRANTSSIAVGAANTNDLRNENSSPALSAGKISSVTKDNTDNISSVTSQLIDVDWTKPLVTNVLIKDGTTNDIDTTLTGTQLDLNYTAAKDTNSGVTNYYYAIGTTPGAKNILGWTVNGTTLSGNEMLTLQNNQKYFVMVKAINGAGLVSDSVASDGVLFLNNTGINGINMISELTIYPNPATENVSISIVSATTKKINYSLTDALGKLIEANDFRVNEGTNLLKIDVVGLGKGIYFIKIVDGGNSITKKLVIE